MRSTRKKQVKEERHHKKQCPECQAFIAISLRECPECGYEYPPQESLPNHGTKAFDGAVLSDQIKPTWVNVVRVSYARHSKEGKVDSVKVTYHAGLGKSYPVWICLDHQGFACRKALAHVEAAGGEATTVTDALEECWDKWATPSRILVKPNGKFFDVLQIDYSKKVEEQMVL